MAERQVEPSETGMAYDIYAPLWGLLDLGAIVNRNALGTTADTVRSWRTFVLPDVLVPGSPTSEATKDRLRDFLHRLERLV